MRIVDADPAAAKGWYLGPWNSTLGIAVGYANQVVNEPHLHRRMAEVYLMARGTVEIRIETETYVLAEGQAILVEPGQARTVTCRQPFDAQDEGIETPARHIIQEQIPICRRVSFQ